MLSSAKSNENRTASLISDMDHLEIAIAKLQEMLERISKYVDSVCVSLRFFKKKKDTVQHIDLCIIL